jgi:hypothetical protein
VCHSKAISVHIKVTIPYPTCVPTANAKFLFVSKDVQDSFVFEGSQASTACPSDKNSKNECGALVE